MIKFKQIRYKNLLSTGNTPIIIDLDKNKTTLIVGSNGAGKSTFLEAISFALYNKGVRNINKPQMINTINGKNMLCEIDFEIGSNEYTVKRGMRPNVFEIIANGVLVNQNAESRDYQKYLEDNILKMSHKTFTQIVLLGARNFRPFMQLPALERRRIVEDLLDIKIFTTMNTILKDKIIQNKTDLQDNQHSINLYDSKLEMHDKHIKAMQTNNKQIIDEKESKIKQYRNDIKELETNASALQEERDVLEKQMITKKELEDQARKINTVQAKLHSSRKKNVKTKDFYTDNDHCPTCQQSIALEFKNDKIESCNRSIVSIDSDLEKISKAYMKVSDRLEKKKDVQAQIDVLKREIMNGQVKISAYRNFILDLDKEIGGLKEIIGFKNDDNILDELKSNLDKEKSKQEVLTKQREVLATAAVLLKDGGIKTHIVKQYVPVMNKLINKYIQSLDFYCSFEFDENFGETMKSRYRDDQSYQNLSEGEKMRIDIALMFTWRMISKMRNSSSTNILIMDEIFDSSIDVTGTDEFLKLIHALTAGTNTYIISHRQTELLDRFDETLKFTKVNNFTRMEIL